MSWHDEISKFGKTSISPYWSTSIQSKMSLSIGQWKTNSLLTDVRVLRWWSTTFVKFYGHEVLLSWSTTFVKYYVGEVLRWWSTTLVKYYVREVPRSWSTTFVKYYVREVLRCFLLIVIYILYSYFFKKNRLISSCKKGPKWSWSYGCWIYNYLCNQCLPSLSMWVRIPLWGRCTRYNIMW